MIALISLLMPLCPIPEQTHIFNFLKTKLPIYSGRDRKPEVISEFIKQLFS